jgi:hypothetical protein
VEARLAGPSRRGVGPAAAAAASSSTADAAAAAAGTAEPADPTASVLAVASW